MSKNKKKKNFINTHALYGVLTLAMIASVSATSSLTAQVGTEETATTESQTSSSESGWWQRYVTEPASSAFQAASNTVRNVIGSDDNEASEQGSETHAAAPESEDAENAGESDSWYMRYIVQPAVSAGRSTVNTARNVLGDETEDDSSEDTTLLDRFVVNPVRNASRAVVNGLDSAVGTAERATGINDSSNASIEEDQEPDIDATDSQGGSDAGAAQVQNATDVQQNTQGNAPEVNAPPTQPDDGPGESPGANAQGNGPAVNCAMNPSHPACQSSSSTSSSGCITSPEDCGSSSSSSMHSAPPNCSLQPHHPACQSSSASSVSSVSSSTSSVSSTSSANCMMYPNDPACQSSSSSVSSVASTSSNSEDDQGDDNDDQDDDDDDVDMDYTVYWKSGEPILFEKIMAWKLSVQRVFFKGLTQMTTSVIANLLR